MGCAKSSAVDDKGGAVKSGTPCKGSSDKGEDDCFAEMFQMALESSKLAVKRIEHHVESQWSVVCKALSQQETRCNSHAEVRFASAVHSRDASQLLAAVKDAGPTSKAVTEPARQVLLGEGLLKLRRCIFDAVQCSDAQALEKLLPQVEALGEQVDIEKEFLSELLEQEQDRPAKNADDAEVASSSSASTLSISKSPEVELDSSAADPDQAAGKSKSVPSKAAQRPRAGSWHSGAAKSTAPQRRRPDPEFQPPPAKRRSSKEATETRSTSKDRMPKSSPPDFPSTGTSTAPPHTSSAPPTGAQAKQRKRSGPSTGYAGFQGRSTEQSSEGDAEEKPKRKSSQSSGRVRIVQSNPARDAHLRALDLQPGSDPSPEEIRAAFRQAALKWHPDRPHNHDDTEGAAKRFQAAKDASDYLCEKDKRRPSV
eukprot:gnl/MRDRNA2_/MRDRNA2_33891_c0_seq1.p1 gnl/MRDRNA2_/MRDRNA2_33891_c0~~gnl/MRDRNA2_/MRDRNA2_33891_c0_seq1.p1  ORF type:complete len:425 (-),score=93.61 gnl/MRDRNA2_/MRDRNA2_33891_c0_seq1:127-1401(-)